ncbi:hypothetical protein BO99DRAFT_407673 [Aspergillus violaceofuscus CBS 115571]|uniref:Uncharacterized protein n=1 Tax=Aspergillus violaceofuscus (strain CBS 115571) TaxID=1450538 RepID=A0A2V5I0J5_ASPV1|nr:hypothetical protein BO99DRAFT_407673 [Aspergillus violaceofuscus CBS 115571]
MRESALLASLLSVLILDKYAGVGVGVGVGRHFVWRLDGFGTSPGVYSGHCIF